MLNEYMSAKIDFCPQTSLHLSTALSTIALALSFALAPATQACSDGWDISIAGGWLNSSRTADDDLRELYAPSFNGFGLLAEARSIPRNSAGLGSEPLNKKTRITIELIDEANNTPIDQMAAEPRFKQVKITEIIASGQQKELFLDSYPADRYERVLNWLNTSGIKNNFVTGTSTLELLTVLRDCPYDRFVFATELLKEMGAPNQLNTSSEIISFFTVLKNYTEDSAPILKIANKLLKHMKASGQRLLVHPVILMFKIIKDLAADRLEAAAHWIVDFEVISKCHDATELANLLATLASYSLDRLEQVTAYLLETHLLRSCKNGKHLNDILICLQDYPGTDLRQTTDLLKELELLSHGTPYSVIIYFLKDQKPLTIVNADGALVQPRSQSPAENLRRTKTFLLDSGLWSRFEAASWPELHNTLKSFTEDDLKRAAKWLKDNDKKEDRTVKTTGVMQFLKLFQTYPAQRLSSYTGWLSGSGIWDKCKDISQICDLLKHMKDINYRVIPEDIDDVEATLDETNVLDKLTSKDDFRVVLRQIHTSREHFVRVVTLLKLIGIWDKCTQDDRGRMFSANEAFFSFLEFLENYPLDSFERSARWLLDRGLWEKCSFKEDFISLVKQVSGFPPEHLPYLAAWLDENAILSKYTYHSVIQDLFKILSDYPVCDFTHKKVKMKKLKRQLQNWESELVAAKGSGGRKNNRTSKVKHAQNMVTEIGAEIKALEAKPDIKLVPTPSKALREASRWLKETGALVKVKDGLTFNRLLETLKDYPRQRLNTVTAWLRSGNIWKNDNDGSQITKLLGYLKDYPDHSLHRATRWLQDTGLSSACLEATDASKVLDALKDYNEDLFELAQRWIQEVGILDQVQKQQWNVHASGIAKLLVYLKGQSSDKTRLQTVAHWLNTTGLNQLKLGNYELVEVLESIKDYSDDDLTRVGTWFADTQFLSKLKHTSTNVGKLLSRLRTCSAEDLDKLRYCLLDEKIFGKEYSPESVVALIDYFQDYALTLLAQDLKLLRESGLWKENDFSHTAQMQLLLFLKNHPGIGFEREINWFKSSPVGDKYIDTANLLALFQLVHDYPEDRLKTVTALLENRWKRRADAKEILIDLDILKPYTVEHLTYTSAFAKEIEEAYNAASSTVQDQVSWGGFRAGRLITQSLDTGLSLSTIANTLVDIPHETVRTAFDFYNAISAWVSCFNSAEVSALLHFYHRCPQGSLEALTPWLQKTGAVAKFKSSYALRYMLHTVNSIPAEDLERITTLLQESGVWETCGNGYELCRLLKYLQAYPSDQLGALTGILKSFGISSIMKNPYPFLDLLEVLIDLPPMVAQTQISWLQVTKILPLCKQGNEISQLITLLNGLDGDAMTLMSMCFSDPKLVEELKTADKVIDAMTTVKDFLKARHETFIPFLKEAGLWAKDEACNGSHIYNITKRLNQLTQNDYDAYIGWLKDSLVLTICKNAEDLQAVINTLDKLPVTHRAAAAAWSAEAIRLQQCDKVSSIINLIDYVGKYPNDRLEPVTRWIQRTGVWGKSQQGTYIVTLLNGLQTFPLDKLDEVTTWLKSTGLWDKSKDAHNIDNLMRLYINHNSDNITKAIKWLKDAGLWDKNPTLESIGTWVRLLADVDLKPLYNPDLELEDQPHCAPVYILCLGTRFEDDRVKDLISKRIENPLFRLSTLTSIAQEHGQDSHIFQEYATLALGYDNGADPNGFLAIHEEMIRKSEQAVAHVPYTRTPGITLNFDVVKEPRLEVPIHMPLNVWHRMFDLFEQIDPADLELTTAGITTRDTLLELRQDRMITDLLDPVGSLVPKKNVSTYSYMLRAVLKKIQDGIVTDPTAINTFVQLLMNIRTCPMGKRNGICHSYRLINNSKDLDESLIGSQAFVREITAFFKEELRRYRETCVTHMVKAITKQPQADPHDCYYARTIIGRYEIGLMFENEVPSIDWYASVTKAALRANTKQSLLDNFYQHYTVESVVKRVRDMINDGSFSIEDIHSQKKLTVYILSKFFDWHTEIADDDEDPNHITYNDEFVDLDENREPTGITAKAAEAILVKLGILNMQE
jgi:hypothetical protein